MAINKGRDFLIKIKASGVYYTVGGLRSSSMTLNHESVDVTNASSPNRWRELLASTGIRDMSVEGSGVFTSSTGERQPLYAMLNNGQVVAQIVSPEYGIFDGTFQIENMRMNAEYNGSIMFSFSMKSAGEIVWTAN